ncbi:MAG: GntR family transcriptional regulator [marine bacterium B5-7]|nr:MAG: GntR family transcriptional regulator [marine bacterium B5-7]
MNASDSLGKLIFRLSLGGLMLFHGIDKITNPGSMDFITGKVAEMGLPDLLAYGVYVGEVLAPIMVIIGLFARIGGLLIAINMTAAIFLVHMGQLTLLNQTGGWDLELQACYLFGGLSLLFMGSGDFAARPD